MAGKIWYPRRYIKKRKKREKGQERNGSITISNAIPSSGLDGPLELSKRRHRKAARASFPLARVPVNRAACYARCFALPGLNGLENGVDRNDPMEAASLRSMSRRRNDVS